MREKKPKSAQNRKTAGNIINPEQNQSIMLKLDALKMELQKWVKILYQKYCRGFFAINWEFLIRKNWYGKEFGSTTQIDELSHNLLFHYWKKKYLI